MGLRGGWREIQEDFPLEVTWPGRGGTKPENKAGRDELSSFLVLAPPLLHLCVLWGPSMGWGVKFFPCEGIKDCERGFYPPQGRRPCPGHKWKMAICGSERI